MAAIGQDLVETLSMNSGINPAWLIPEWPAPARVHAIVTTRTGGQSVAPYDQLNLADHVGDSAARVASNRALLQRAIQARPVFLSQVHGTQAVLLSDTTAQGATADGCLANQPRLACTIMVADCMPVLLTNTEGSLVAAAHAGWRSLAAHGGPGIIEHIYEYFTALAPVDSSQVATKLIAWLGPCIGPQAFEVGPEVRAAFVAHDPAAADLFAPKISDTSGTESGQKWLANLPGLARLRLNALGVTQIYGNDGTRPWCTVSNPSRFFSHRRDRVSGRMAACIWLD